MLARADDDGHATMSLQEILNHRKNDRAYELKHKYVCVNNQKKLRKSTQGWDLEVTWQDEPTYWLPLEDLKKSNHVEVAEHATARNIDNEIAFNLWVPYVLEKREVITSQVTYVIRRNSLKCGIYFPTSLKHAAEIYSRNKNTFGEMS